MLNKAYLASSCPFTTEYCFFWNSYTISSSAGWFWRLDVNVIRDLLDVLDTPAYQQPCTVMSPFLFLRLIHSHLGEFYLLSIRDAVDPVRKTGVSKWFWSIFSNNNTGIIFTDFIWVWNLAFDPPRKGDILNEFQKDSEKIMRTSEWISYRRMYKPIHSEKLHNTGSTNWGKWGLWMWMYNTLVDNPGTIRRWV
jgi:hypothetical protein